MNYKEFKIGDIVEWESPYTKVIYNGIILELKKNKIPQNIKITNVLYIPNYINDEEYRIMDIGENWNTIYYHDDTITYYYPDNRTKLSKLMNDIYTKIKKEK